MATSPYAPQPIPPDPYPYRDLGVVLVCLGIGLLVVGIFLASVCGVGFGGICLDYPYAGVGDVLAGIGIVLLIVGLVLLFVPGARPQQPVPPVVYVPQPMLYPPPLLPERFCPVCGTGNQRVSTYCISCGRPLPPPP